jgi:hypothetical protein
VVIHAIGEQAIDFGKIVGHDGEKNSFVKGRTGSPGDGSHLYIYMKPWPLSSGGLGGRSGRLPCVAQASRLPERCPDVSRSFKGRLLALECGGLTPLWPGRGLTRPRPGQRACER